MCFSYQHIEILISQGSSVDKVTKLSHKYIKISVPSLSTY